MPDPPEERGCGTPEELAVCHERLEPKVLLDSDAARAFTEMLPVAYWLRAAESSPLPARQRKEIAVGAWVRSVLLDDEVYGERAVALLGTLSPELKAGLEKYAQAVTPDERRYEAALLLLKQPELNPEVRAGNGREDLPGHIDPYGNNWWCASGSTGLEDDYAMRYYRFFNSWTPLLAKMYGNQRWQLAFLTVDELKTEERETSKLAGVGPGPNWLSIQAVAFAKAHPDDPRAREALHLAVQATRHGAATVPPENIPSRPFNCCTRNIPTASGRKKLLTGSSN